MPSAEKWLLAERLASELEVEWGSDVARLIRMNSSELEKRLEILEGSGFSTVNRRKAAGEGLRTVNRDA